MEGYIGEIRMFAGNFAPRGWAFCQGQIMGISTNTALFSILGTTYGGDGQTTFGLPDFRSRVAVGAGQGPALSYYALGQKAGVERNTLLPTNIPAHTHNLMVSSSNSDTATPVTGSTIAVTGTQDARTFTPALSFNSATPNVALNAASITPAGGSNVPVNNIQPYLGINYIICLQGMYPSRN
jgi:microcystin-dependent protein